MLILTSILFQNAAAQHIDLVAIVGIIGTLLGAGLGAFVTWRIQKTQLDHQDRTRFHDQRLKAYTDFNGSCNRIVASYMSGGPILPADANLTVSSFETLRLIASLPVVTASSQVYSIMFQAMNGQVADRNQFFHSFNQALGNLATTMRMELGTPNT